MKTKLTIIIGALLIVVYFLVGSDGPKELTTGSTPLVSVSPTAVATQSPRPSGSAMSSPTTVANGLILLSVPFTSQAPSGNWSDPRLQDGCEEASAIMAMAWVNGAGIANPEKQILAISDWEQATYGNYHDTSAQDTVTRIFNTYFKYTKVRAQNGPSATDIISELKKGNLIITPMDGRKLKNPHYTPPGPDRHMLVVVGYDPKTDEFITNDPGTRLGKSYRYGSALFMSSILNYPTGNHEPVQGSPKAMIVVSR